MKTVPCPTCHFENPDLFKFCGQCGSSLLAPVFPSSDSTDGESILIVDDEPHITQLVQHLFELEGIRAHVAGSVHEALASIAAEKPSVIITDMNMPDTNGNEFIQMLKKNQETDKIKIIVLTVIDAFEEIRKSILLGADDYICKPFDPQELLWSTQRLLGKFQFTKGQPEAALD